MSWYVTGAAGIQAESELLKIFIRCGYRECPRPDPAIKQNAIALSSAAEDQNKIDFWICIPTTNLHDFKWIPVQFTVARRREYVRAKRRDATERGIAFLALDLQELKVALSDRAAGVKMVSSITGHLRRCSTN